MELPEEEDEYDSKASFRSRQAFYNKAEDETPRFGSML